MNRELFGATVGLVALVVGYAIAGGVLDESVDARVAGLCVNGAGDRVEDTDCGEDWDENGIATGARPGSYLMWIDTTTYSGRVPAVGQRITVGQRTLAKGTPAARGVPAAGGDMQAIRRGGFGAGGAKAGGGS